MPTMRVPADPAQKEHLIETLKSVADGISQKLAKPQQAGSKL